MFNARLKEETISVNDVSASESTDAIDLYGAFKFSIQVVATDGDCIAHLEASNNGETWDEVDSFSLNEGESDMFEDGTVSYHSARITIEKDGGSTCSADCLVLVIGDSQ